MLAVEAARRGAEVVAIDVAPTLIALARERAPEDLGEGSIDFRVGDMLAPSLGAFDYVVAMDSLIHYRAEDMVRALSQLTARARRGVLFTFAPRTPALAVMHAVGRLFPRSDRAPAIVPVTEHRVRRLISACARGAGVAARPHQACRARFLHVAGHGARRGMRRMNDMLSKGWLLIGPRFLPFADVATADLPLARLMRLALFQVSVGMAVVLLNGTLNRVMIVELEVPSWLVALMVSLPLVFAPLRALIGFRSDTHRSALGWRRVPYIWMGTLLQFGGLAIMPFALIVLSGDTNGPPVFGDIGAALAFLLVGAGLHTTQTAGLALATDLAPESARPRVVAFLYVMLLVGMVVSAIVFGLVLANFSEMRLIQVIQGAALLTMILNIIALWKQEARQPSLVAPDEPRPSFSEAWQAFRRAGLSRRVLIVVGLGTAAFSMQDILLEPYGGEVLRLSVGETTALTAMLGAGTLTGLALAARWLGAGIDPYRLAAFGVLAGVIAFSAVIFAAPFESPAMFRTGAVLIGFGGGLFAVGTMTAAMALARDGQSGLALGAWGAVQASAAGLAIAFGGAARDVASDLASRGTFGSALAGPATGYGFVYYVEIVMLFVTLAAIGPLVRPATDLRTKPIGSFGLAEFPG